MALDPLHEQELRASGISEELIAQCGFYSASPEEAGQLLGWPNPAPSRALVFPYLDAQGNVVLNRLKLDQPRSGAHDGQQKTIKYEAPRGSRLRLFVPPPAYPKLAALDELLIITEGEKKAASAASRGFTAVGIAGVFCWKDRQKSQETGRDELLADFDQIALNGHRVAVVFDSDIATKHQVKKAEARLAKALQARGAIVIRTTLPAGAEGTKQGLDDFLTNQGDAGTEALRALIEAAAQPRSTRESRRGLPPAIKTAETFLGMEYSCGGDWTLRRHRETFHRWDKGRYEPIVDEEVEAHILRYLAVALGHKLATPAYARAVLRCVQSLVMVDGSVNPPAWLGGQSLGPDFRYVAMENGVLDLEKVFAGVATAADCLMPPSPVWFSPTVLDYPFNEQADCPAWLSFLDHVLEGDAERIQLAQEIFGSCLVPDTSYQRFVLLHGDGANGKSVFCELLGAVLGPQNVAHVPLEVFSQRFALTATLGKLANIASEIGEIDKVAEGLLKAFVAGDAMTFDRKNKNPVEARPTARLVLSTNNLPRFADRSQGIWRRILLLPFRVRIPEGNEDRHLADRLKMELPGIFNWSLVGLARLRQQNRFAEPALCAEALAEYREESNPTRCFLELHCSSAPGNELPASALYERYADWMRRHGYRALAEAVFGREVRRVFPGVTRPRLGPRGQRYYAYRGIAYSSGGPAAVRSNVASVPPANDGGRTHAAHTMTIETRTS